MADEKKPAGPDLTKGVPLSSIADGGMLLGHVGDERCCWSGGRGAVRDRRQCTHYHGPLAEGLVGGDGALPLAPCLLRPAHRRGAACAGAQSARLLDGRAAATIIGAREARAAEAAAARQASAQRRERIVIVGGGAAGFAAAEMLRRADYQNAIAMLSNDDAPPVDRPNLSKDYLAGSAPEEWMPLRPDEFYTENGIDLRLNTDVGSIDVTRARRHARGRQQRALRPPAARDRRRAGAASHPRRRPAARAHAALARRLPRDHQGRRGRQARGRDRRELHRPRSRGLAARAQARGPRGRAGEASDGTRARAADGRLRARAARGARRHLPSGGHGDGDRRQAR